MICECDAPVPSHLRMSHTVIRKPRMHGSPERSPGVIEILESKVFTVSSPSLPALSHEQATVTRVFIPARCSTLGFLGVGNFLRSFLLTTRSLHWYITSVK